MRTLIILLFVLMTAINVKAYDHVVDGLYYNIIDVENKFVEVTFGSDTMNSYAFSQITIPEEITIQDEIYLVKRIGEKAFVGCDHLQSIQLPKNIKSIGNSSFAACKNLTSINLPNSIESIDIFAFAMCEKLEQITLPSGLDRIADALFAGCSNLKHVTIPAGVNYIGQKAFFLCSSLEAILIPEGVKDLNGCATFLGCKNLKKMVFEWEDPVEVHPYFTNDINPETCVLVVPKGSKTKYEKAKGWKNFKIITEDEI